MISIIIPVHNQADKIGACLKSILTQTYKEWELIVVNDGSTDNIEKVLDKWSNNFFGKNFQFFSKENEGSQITRNYGFTKSSGEYVIFCDADIIMEPYMLEKMIDTLKANPEASFAYSSFNYGTKLFKLFPYSEDRLKKMPFIHTSSLIRRQDFPNFDPAIKRLQDWDLWLTMMENNKKGVFIDKPLFTAQIGGGHFSSWLPSITYKILPFLPAVKKYKLAVSKIKEKHNLL
ncbi:MAG: glycosyltransferase family A protein [Candidatus Falkowbacteria bacterium]|nr:glycosyltransferase family A protein [Candidatus Falkowbacteria bacterium]